MNPYLDSDDLLDAAAELSADAPTLAPLPKPVGTPEPQSPRLTRGGSVRRAPRRDDWTWLIPVILGGLFSFGFWAAFEFEISLIVVLPSLMLGSGVATNVACLSVITKLFQGGERQYAITATVFFFLCGLIAILMTISRGWSLADDLRMRRLMSVFTWSIIGNVVALVALLGFTGFKAVDQVSAELARAQRDAAAQPQPQNPPAGQPHREIGTPREIGMPPDMEARHRRNAEEARTRNEALRQRHEEALNRARRGEIPNRPGNPNAGRPATGLSNSPSDGPHPFPSRRSNSARSLESVYRALLLSEDPEHWKESLRWCRGLGRPALAIRWGLGVTLPRHDANEGGPPLVKLEVEELDNERLRQLTRTIGGRIADGIDDVASSGDIGSQLKVGQFPNDFVALVGVALREDLVRAARDSNLDVLATIELVQKTASDDVTLVVHFTDLLDGRLVNSSEPLQTDNLRSQFEFTDRVVAYIDQEFRLQQVREIPPQRAQDRLSTLQSNEHTGRSYIPLAEVRFYELLGLLDESETQPFYEKALGPDHAQQFMTGDAAQRDESIRNLFDESS